MSGPQVSFVIPVRNDAARLVACLASIRAGQLREADIEILVADNGSTDRSADVARAAGATVLSLPGLRLGELRNRAAAAASGPVLAFVDADHEIVPGWIAAALDAFTVASVAGVGAPCHPPAPGTWVQRAYDRLRRHPATRQPVEWLGSGNMAVKKSAFDEVGGFDTALETCEDVDLCRKLRAAGYSLLADSRMKNIHHGDPRTLGQVFYGELWRGRDNIRVSLRPPFSGRTVASAVVPLANLTATLMLVAGVLAGPEFGFATATVAAAFLTVMIVLRASTMTGLDRLADWPQACAVAAAYEAGRALAVAGRFGYRRRRAAIA
jgi:hypothetical protein